MMRFQKLWLACALLVACNGAEGTSARRFELRYIKADAALIDQVRSAVDSASASSTMIQMRADEPEAITVSADPATLDRVARTIAQLDRPQGNVRLRFQVIEADGFAGSDPAIADVEAVLRDLFRFRGYRLGAEALVQAQSPGRVLQQLRTADGVPLTIVANVLSVTPDAGGGSVSLNVELAAHGSSILGTSLTVPTGKTAVVGSAQGESKTTLILVVRPEIQ